MASTIHLVLAPQDEEQLFTFLEPWNLVVYPELIPPDYTPFPADRSAVERLTDEAYYLAAEHVAPVHAYETKRGKNRGMLVIEETESPVIHYTRSVLDDGGVLQAGRLWTALSLNEIDKHPARSEAFRKIWVALREYVVHGYRRSRPAGWFIGPEAARKAKSGLKLREAGHKGKALTPFR